MAKKIKTVLITGASSGIGKATAQFFFEKGWNVVATARSPESIQDLESQERLIKLRLDVTDVTTIEEAISKALAYFGKIDVLVNNAGYGLLGSFEASTPEQIERQFNTNVFGLFEVTRALLPHFRERHSGTIINISSIGGRMTFPFGSLYHATKWAVEGFSESLQYELEPLGIRVKIIEPGAIRTDFASRSLELTSKPGLKVYDTSMQLMMQKTEQSYKTAAVKPTIVAKAIYRAATDNSSQLRYPVAALFLKIRKLLPDSLIFAMIRQLLLK